MCRLFAHVGRSASLEELLLLPAHGLVRQAFAPRHQVHGRINADGFGAGWYDLERRPEPARYRSARPMWSDRSFASLAGLVTSTTVLASVRNATPPSAVEESNAAPFTWGTWLFAHNGSVDRFTADAGIALRRRLSERRLAGIEGSADSEVLFAHALTALDEGAGAAEALVATVAAVRSISGGRLNLMLTDGRRLVATACGDTLFVLEGTGMAAGGVIVASEPCDDDTGWERVPDDSVVQVGPDGGVVVSALSGAATGTR